MFDPIKKTRTFPLYSESAVIIHPPIRSLMLKRRPRRECSPPSAGASTHRLRRTAARRVPFPSNLCFSPRHMARPRPELTQPPIVGAALQLPPKLTNILIPSLRRDATCAPNFPSLRCIIPSHASCPIPPSKSHPPLVARGCCRWGRI